MIETCNISSNVSSECIGEVVQTVEELREGGSVFWLGDPAARHDLKPGGES